MYLRNKIISYIDLGSTSNNCERQNNKFKTEVKTGHPNNIYVFIEALQMSNAKVTSQK